MKKSLSWFSVCALFFLVPVSASAHTLLGGGFGLQAGISHPFSGLDHMLAMVAVGIWAVQTGGRSVWMVPLSFVTVMLLGGLMAYMGVHLPFVEQGIGISVIFLGLLILSAVTLTPALGSALVGVFALFHGYAHGAELPHLSVAMSYTAGFVFATALLHGAGLVAGHWLKQGRAQVALRYLGGAIALGGAYLFAV